MKVSEKLQAFTDKEGEFVWFHCPGCNMKHIVATKYNEGHENFHTGKKKPVWVFNGDLVKPTIKPSIMVRWVGAEPPQCCHSIIREGEQIFLIETTHKFSGTRVKMKDDEG